MFGLFLSLLLVYNGNSILMMNGRRIMIIENVYNNVIKTLRQFTNNTNRLDQKSSKRTVNYLEWCKLKPEIIDKEKDFILTEDKKALVKRVNVLWVDFGFNIGCEFGGRHPAIIVKEIGKGIYVIPVDSGKIPEKNKDKNYYINIPYIFGFKKRPRYCNTYKMVCIDPRRIDFTGDCGRVHGKIMTKISDSLKSNVIC